MREVVASVRVVAGVGVRIEVPDDVPDEQVLHYAEQRVAEVVPAHLRALQGPVTTFSVGWEIHAVSNPERVDRST